MAKLHLSKVKHFLFRKKMIPVLIGVVLVLFLSVRAFGKTENISIIIPSFGELAKTVSATGEVTSKTDLDLSFNKTGTVKKVAVEVGDRVKAGQILASLDLRDASAQVTQARGALLVSQAKLKRVLEGSTNEELSLAKVALTNAKNSYDDTKKEQETLVKNAHSKLLNSSLEARPKDFASGQTPPTISGNWQFDTESTLNINVYSTGDGQKFSISGPITGEGNVSLVTPQPLGNSGLYILFSGTISNSNWVVEVPNQKAADYITNKNSYDAALKTQSSALLNAQSLVDQRQAELALKQASARTSDVELAEAEVVSAQGGLERAQSNYEDNIIRAPSTGTVTKVDIKYGELADVNKTSIIVEDLDNLYVEAEINESDIAEVVFGQKSVVTFDAFGSDRKFGGTVSHVDPSSALNAGVVNYKIKIILDAPDPDIRPGMNAEVEIKVDGKNNVISVPLASVIKRDGQSYLNIVTNEKKNKYKETAVTLGITGNGNMVEVTSGLNREDKIAISDK